LQQVAKSECGKEWQSRFIRHCNNRLLLSRSTKRRKNFVKRRFDFFFRRFNFSNQRFIGGIVANEVFALAVAGNKPKKKGNEMPFNSIETCDFKDYS